MMILDVSSGFLIALVATHIKCIQGTHPPGHMQPLGSHQPPETPGIDVLESAPSPEDFFLKYVEGSRPFLIRNLAKDMPAFKLWNDAYLKSTYGHIEVDVEQGKKENRSNSLWTMTLSEFLDRYNKSDLYLVHSLPKEMMGDIWLIKSLLCGGFTKNLLDAVAWFSSGGTKSVFHFDALDNINCLFDGTKELILVPRAYAENLGFAAQGSFSAVDVDHVDMIKYPQYADIPWYNLSMVPGDCIYIPYRWAHQVRSTGRNLAINIWFVHQHTFDYEDCMLRGKVPEFSALSNYGLSATYDVQMRGSLVDFVKIIFKGSSIMEADIPAAVEAWIAKFQGELVDFVIFKGGSITEADIPAAIEYFGASEEELKVVFTFLDANRDGKITRREVENADMEGFRELLEALDVRTDGPYGSDDEGETSDKVDDDDDDDSDEKDDDDDHHGDGENINEIDAGGNKKSHLETNKSEL